MDGFFIILLFGGLFYWSHWYLNFDDKPRPKKKLKVSGFLVYGLLALSSGLIARTVVDNRESIKEFIINIF